MTKAPKVTVLMPVYNAESFLAEALNSILVQTYKDFELLVIDDGSSDNSLHLLQQYSDPRVRILQNKKNLGLIATLNRGVSEARGEYIARMDADDISLPLRLEKQVRFMDSNPGISLCGTYFQNITGTGEPLDITKYATDHETIVFRQLFQVQFGHGTVMMRKSALPDQGPYSPDFPHAEDYELWVRLSGKCRLANLPEVLYQQRQHVASVSSVHQSVQATNTKRIILQQFEKYFHWKLTEKEYTVHMDVSYANFYHTKEDIAALEKFLLAWKNRNESTQSFPVSFLNKYIASKWFHFLYNSPLGKARAGIYFRSALPKTGIVNQLKLVIKSFL